MDFSAERLDGWKAIAAYIGRSDRVAQRWHAERGMPVHRVPGGKSGGVFGFARELDAWFASESRLEPPVVAPSPASEGVRLLRWWLVVVIAALTAAAVWFPIWVLRPRPALVDAVFTDVEIVARGASGQTLWSYAVGHRLVRFESARHIGARRAGARPFVVDLDGDGRNEVLAVVGKENRDAPVPTQELVCLSDTGRLLWRYRPDMSHRFGAGQFGPPWLVSNVLVTGATTKTIWLSLIHSVWWPSILVRLDSAGKPTIALVHSGSIYALSELPGGTRSRVLAGGVNNEWRSAMLAVVDETDPPMVSPQTPASKFECLDCSARPNSRYTLLPPTEFNQLDPTMPQYNWVQEIFTEGIEKRIQVVESEAWNALSFYRYAAATQRVLDFSLADSARRTHGELEAAGRVGHRYDECPMRRQAAVRYADGRGGWTTALVPAR